jgi:cobalt/nickel transport system ATP-binding protein
VKPVCLRLENITFGYSSGRPLFTNLDFEISAGKIGLIGQNGCGKTTFLHLIMGLHQPEKGRVYMDDRQIQTSEDWRYLRRYVGFLFQDADDQLFSPTVIEDVAFGLLNMGDSPGDARIKSERMLDRLGLAGFEDRLTHRLSGGEKKLVALATILVMEPRFLLLDEPTNNLDAGTRRRLVEIITRLDIPMLIISHDWDFLAQTTSHVYSMAHGHLHKSETECLHTHPHAHAHGDHPHDHGGGEHG